MRYYHHLNCLLEKQVLQYLHSKLIKARKENLQYRLSDIVSCKLPHGSFEIGCNNPGWCRPLLWFACRHHVYELYIKVLSMLLNHFILGFIYMAFSLSHLSLSSMQHLQFLGKCQTYQLIIFSKNFKIPGKPLSWT